MALSLYPCFFVFLWVLEKRSRTVNVGTVHDDSACFKCRLNSRMLRLYGRTLVNLLSCSVCSGAVAGSNANQPESLPAFRPVCCPNGDSCARSTAAKWDSLNGHKRSNLPRQEFGQGSCPVAVVKDIPKF
uniref:Putative secreted protein n=1 Tax=Ixodes ricinus TaxID=34613 RepID=A0A147BST5_IXORI